MSPQHLYRRHNSLRSCPPVGCSCNSSVLLADGRVLVAGGGAAAEIYNPVTNRWNTAGFLTASYTKPSLTLLPDGQVLIAENTFEILNPQTGISTAISPIPWKDPSPPGAELGLNSNYRVVVLDTGEVLFTSTQSDQIYNPQTGTWWILQSSTNFSTYDTHQWGLAGDIPVLQQP